MFPLGKLVKVINKMIYQINFRPISPITKIPDANTFFGAFCYAYKFINKEDGLNQFIKENILSNKVMFSSMFYKNCLPLPMDLKIMHNENDNYSITDCNIFKKIKKIKYISKSLYINYQKNKEKFKNEVFNQIKNGTLLINNLGCLIAKNEEEEFNYIIKDEMRIRNKVAYKEEDKQLFYNYLFYCSDNVKFSVYLKCDDLVALDKIKATLKEISYLSIGGGKSLGYNMFEFIDITKEDGLLSNSPTLLLSKCLCSKDINYLNSMYRFKIINNKFNIPGDTVYRKQLYCLEEGSIINSKSNIGRLIEEKVNDSISYQYYVGMLI